MRAVELLPISEFRVLRVIEIHGPEWNGFTGFLAYTRLFNPGVYDWSKGDELDDIILSTIKKTYPESRLRYCQNIFLKGELEDILKTIEGQAAKQVSIILYPLVTDDLLKGGRRTFRIHPLDFKLRLWLSPFVEKMGHIWEHYKCDLPYDKLDDYAQTIQPL